jgi:G3E family GTPase
MTEPMESLLGPRAGRAELIVLSGGVTPVAARAADRVVDRVRAEHPRTAVLTHDLDEVGQGVVTRRLRLDGEERVTVLELAHGCVSCTLREDVLPLLRALGRHPGVDRIVLRLDPALEPELVCTAILGVLVDGAPVTDAVDLRGVVTVLDESTWLDDATGEAELDERGLADLPGDERTLAQLVVAQAECADLIVHAGDAEPWVRARTTAVLARLAPLAERVPAGQLDRRLLLERLPLGARRGRPESPHAPLLRGQPPLEDSAGVRLLVFTARRPFHPQRLHDAIDALLDGVVRSRGRVWLATRPSAVLWLESAGGGLQVGYAGDWLTAGDADAWAEADAERHAQAALRWHSRWGDRAQDLAVLVHDADPAAIEAELTAALLDDAELAGGEQAWRSLPDPFGFWHEDPCDDVAPRALPGPRAPGADPD